MNGGLSWVMGSSSWPELVSVMKVTSGVGCVMEGVYEVVVSCRVRLGGQGAREGGGRGKGSVGQL